MPEENPDEALFEDLNDICVFCECAGDLRLRQYQQAVARAVLEAVFNERGLSFVVMFPRQSGKNELQAQLEAYLLACLHLHDAQIIKISPTYRPQAINAMRRLERVLEQNLIFRATGWKKEGSTTYRVGRARIDFLSGAPESNIVGATASTLLEVDEAQDVLPSKYDKDIAPMAASTNATRVFWGTAWTSNTLLAREMRSSLAAEQLDGVRRVWRLTADEVAAEVPAYRAFVDDQVARLGRNHPLVKTQFFSEEIDGQGGMFPPERRALMQGEHGARSAPAAGCIYAVLLDVAGEDEAGGVGGEDAAAGSTKRDATALTVVEVDLSTLADPIIHAPRYRVVDRHLWVGMKQSALYAQVRGLADHWRARYLAVDATGVGAGLASFLASVYQEKVISFVFSGASKSALAWDYLSVVESGRYKDHQAGSGSETVNSLQARFWRELESCQMEVMPGPERRVKWGVPNGMKGADGEFIHDDLVLSAALCAVLDDQIWGLSGPSLIVSRADPLAELDRGY